jgi:hypothetical protein
MKKTMQTPNAKCSTPNAEFRGDSERWMLSVGRFLPTLQ